jgi:hypothetical protein
VAERGAISEGNEQVTVIAARSVVLYELEAQLREECSGCLGPTSSIRECVNQGPPLRGGLRPAWRSEVARTWIGGRSMPVRDGHEPSMRAPRASAHLPLGPHPCVGWLGAQGDCAPPIAPSGTIRAVQTAVSPDPWSGLGSMQEARHDSQEQE